MASRTVLVGLCVLLLGCPREGAQPKVEPTAEAPSDPRRARAGETARALGARLKERLGGAIQEGGFAGGIAACKVAAPEIAQAVGAEQGLKIGRTSFKLRNPANAPPEWAKASVEARVETATFSDGPGGTLRALLPIRMEGLCVSCHGQPADLAEGVSAALAAKYPADQATGFAEGELRGWFWVELPPQ